MYDFIGLDIATVSTELPSVAMNFNGIFIEDIIPEYKTLTVSGRELMGRRIIPYGDIPGRDGIWVKEITEPPRYLQISYQIEADTDEDYRTAFNKLNAILRTTEDVKVYFNDEEDWSYWGQLELVGEPDTSTNSAIGSFVIICQDPYKYSDPVELTGNSITVGLGASYSYDVYKLKATLSKGANKVIIKNETTGKRIIANGTFTAGQVLEIENKELKLNGQNIMKRLDYVESDWHQFEIGAGHIITVTPSSPMVLTLRERKL